MKNTNNNLQNTQTSNAYDDDNIPEVDLPQDKSSNCVKPVEPLPESSRPRKDGPGGN